MDSNHVLRHVIIARFPRFGLYIGTMDTLCAHEWIRLFLIGRASLLPFIRVSRKHISIYKKIFLLTMFVMNRLSECFMR